MIVFVWAAGPLVLGVLAGRVSPALARRLPPATAAVLLTTLALTVSLATGMILCLAGGMALAELLPGLHPHDWQIARLRHSMPWPPAAGFLAGILGALLLALAVVHLVRQVRGIWRASTAARALPHVDGLAIVDDVAVHAYAVPGRSARVVVSTGLLRSLSADQRRAVLAHERAHLRHRHHLYAQLAALAASANPLLRPVARSVAVSLERWADAVAATVVGSRDTVAHALGVAALGGAAPSAVLGAADCAVVERVQLLLDPPAQGAARRLGGAALVVAAVVTCWACAAGVVLDLHHAVNVAEATAARHG